MSQMLWRASLRHLARHPWQIGLSILGIALGVAVALSIDLANESARRSFSIFAESMAGRATHQIVGGPSRVPESVYRTLRLEAGLRRSAPVVEQHLAAPDFPGMTFHLLGIDPFAESPFRSFLGAGLAPSLDDLSALLTRPGGALIARETARRLGLRRGDTLAVRVGSARRQLTLVGELIPRDSLSARALESTLVTDIATAQEVLGEVGRLSRIDLILPDGAQGDAEHARLAALLPPDVQIGRAGRRATVVEQLTGAFAINLTALSLLALVVGMFLIYNTMTFSVVQRRELIGVLRALGVSRGEVFGIVLGEAALIGLIATAGGILLGILLAQGMVRFVAQTINDLYVTLAVRDVAVPPLSLARAALLGLGGTLLAALAPAFEATATTPRAALHRSIVEARSRRAAPQLAVIGIGVLTAGILALLPARAPIVVAYAALFAVLVGAALLTPWATIVLMTLARAPMGWLFGLPGRMAAGSVVAALSRTAVALAALMIAVAATVGIGIMIGSFRLTVVRWLDSTLQSDVYVSSPSLVSNRPDTTLEPALIARLISTPGLVRVNTNRTVRVESSGGAFSLVVLDVDAHALGRFSFVRGQQASVASRFWAEGAVIVSEPLAYHRALGVGSRLRLRTDRGEREFPVAAVVRDYGSPEGAVMMSRATYEQFWDDRAISALGLVAAPGIDPDVLVGLLRQAAGPDQEVLIRSNRALRVASLEVFDRTFAITIVLRLLATAVAFVGVLSALMALGFERARELAVLRAQGFTPGQVWTLVTGQSGLMGAAAGILAIPVGIALSVILVFVINQRTFGWTLQLELAPGTLMQGLALAVVAALLASIAPARRSVRQSLPDALRDE
jgi:putative ABC transport system permease protein